MEPQPGPCFISSGHFWKPSILLFVSTLERTLSQGRSPNSGHSCISGGLHSAWHTVHAQ